MYSYSILDVTEFVVIHISIEVNTLRARRPRQLLTLTVQMYHIGVLIPVSG